MRSWGRIPLCALTATIILLAGATARAADYVLRTEPPLGGATVFVDGTFSGLTDENGKVAIAGVEPGRHDVRIEIDGATYTAPYDFDPDLSDLPAFSTTAQPDANLSLAIESNAPDAAIFVDGYAAGRTDAGGRATLSLLPHHNYRIVLQKPGREPAKAEFRAGTEPGSLRLDLTRLPSAEGSSMDPILVVLLLVFAISVVLLLLVLIRSRNVRGPVAETTTDRAMHFDRYRLINTLGSGGVGTIYRAFDLVDKSTVALKILDARWLSDPDMVRKFLAEGEALEAIHKTTAGPPVVQCFRYGREHNSVGGRPYVAMELLEGETLDVRLHREPVLNEATAIGIGCQIARALVAVHSSGIVHRDLTPDNVFLRQGEVALAQYRFRGVPSVVLIDFGIAKLEVLQKFTMDGSIAGKPQYMSPEQCRGSRVDARSDLYALGIILYQMVSGRTPFSGRDPFDIMRAQQSDAPVALSPSVSPAYVALVMDLLRKRPEDRPESAKLVAQELEQLFAAAVAAGAFMNLVQFPERRRSV